MKKLIASLAVVIVALGPCRLASAWWDTAIRAMTAEPLTQAVEAEKCIGADVRADKQANGGRGGQAAYVKPGGELSFQAALKPSIYDIWIIARADAADEQAAKPAASRPVATGPKTTARGAEAPAPEAFTRLTVKLPDGKTRSWQMPIAFRDSYAVVSKIYFPVHAEGQCQFTVGLDGESRRALLFDRVEIRDVLGNCPRVAAKEKRMLTSDEDLAKLREAFQADPKNKDRKWTVGRQPAEQWSAAPRDAAARTKTARSSSNIPSVAPGEGSATSAGISARPPDRRLRRARSTR